MEFPEGRLCVVSSMNVAFFEPNCFRIAHFHQSSRDCGVDKSPVVQWHMFYFFGFLDS